MSTTRSAASTSDEFARVRIRPNSYLMTLCASFSRCVHQRRLQVFHQHSKGQLGERMLRRFRYQLYQRLLRFRSPISKNLAGPDHPDDYSRVRAARVLSAMPLSPRVPGGTLLTIIFFISCRTCSVPRRCALPIQATYPEIATQGQRARQARYVRCARSPTDQRVGAGIAEYRPTIRQAAPDPLRAPLGTIYISASKSSPQVFRQVLNNFIANDAVFLLLDRRLL